MPETFAANGEDRGSLVPGRFPNFAENLCFNMCGWKTRSPPEQGSR